MTKRTARAGGYTLIELVIVVTLMALIAAIGVPLFARSLDRAEARAAAGKIAALMRLARAEAIARKIPTTVLLESDTARVYAIAGRPDPAKPPLFLDTAIEMPRTAKLWTGRENHIAVEWSPRGSAGAALVHVTAANARREDDENGYTVEVEPLTGRPRLSRNGEETRW